jgi:hypothetical protein
VVYSITRSIMNNWISHSVGVLFQSQKFPPNLFRLIFSNSVFETTMCLYIKHVRITLFFNNFIKKLCVSYMLIKKKLYLFYMLNDTWHFYEQIGISSSDPV